MKKKSKRRWSSVGLTAEGRAEMFSAHAVHRRLLSEIAQTFGSSKRTLDAKHLEAITHEKKRASDEAEEIRERDRRRADRLAA